MKQADADGLDTGLAPCRSRRGRRAAALIAMSAIAVVVAGYPYVGPAPTFAGQTGGPIPSSQMVQPLGDLISYSVVNRLLAWALVAEVSPPSDLGQFWIFVTVDGAKHWRQQFAGKSSYIALTITSFQFFDSKNGHVVAGNPYSSTELGTGVAIGSRTRFQTPPLRKSRSAIRCTVGCSRIQGARPRSIRYRTFTQPATVVRRGASCLIRLTTLWGCPSAVPVRVGAVAAALSKLTSTQRPMADSTGSATTCLRRDFPAECFSLPVSFSFPATES